MNPGGRLEALEGLRGHGAFLVFLVHAFGLLAARWYGVDADTHAIRTDEDPLRVLLVFLTRSHYGVDLFFVLSGLLMADLALRRWPGTGPFLRRRALRIYPAYALSTVIAGAVAALAFAREFPATDWWANAALVQGFFVLGFAAVNPVTWSLSYEAAFYLGVPTLAALWAGRAPLPAGLAAAFVAVLALAFAVPTPKAIYFAYFALFVPGIALGAMGAAERERLAARVPLAAVAAAWAAFTLAMKLEFLANTGPAYYACSALACGLVVLKACDTGGALARVLASPPFRWLGRRSYSFFLIHYVVVHAWGAFAATLVPPADRLAYGLLYLSGSLVLSLAAASALYALAERFYFKRQ